MKIYLQNIVHDLKQFSQSLDKQSMLINKPWALIDSELGIQKLIFKKNKELILSKDGQVTEGKWDYFPEAKSLLIDRGFDKILCNETYIDSSILVLKMDGKKDDFFVLANENSIPDLDAYAYLRKLYLNKYGIHIAVLADERNMLIKPLYGDTIGVGSGVTIEASIISDGEYIAKDGFRKFFVQNNKIADIKYLKKYNLENGECLVVEQQENNNLLQVDCVVTINNRMVPDGEYRLEKENMKLLVSNSRIEKILYLKVYDLVNSTQIVIEQNSEYSFNKGDQVWMDGKVAKDGKYKLIADSYIKVYNGTIVKMGMQSEKILLLVIFGFILITMLFAILVSMFGA